MLTPSSNLLAPLFHGVSAEQIFAPEHQLKLMVKFEVALAYSLEEAGIAPQGTGALCEGAVVGFPNDRQRQTMVAATADSGNLAIPFVRLLTSQVRDHAGNAADFIHYGATSQDLLDTALVLALREFAQELESSVNQIVATLVNATETNREPLLPGRTWMQQGPPVPFALKTAQWLSAMLRHRQRLADANDGMIVLQFGGAVGTLASLGSSGGSVTEKLGERLALRVPDVPWHSQRDTLAAFAAALALLDGTLGKIARDLSLMVQTEVGEAVLAGPAGAGGSSTMPHKRNPVALAVALSAAIRAPGLVATMLSAMVQEHERGLGGWHAEWDTLPELCRITAGSALAIADALDSLELDAQAMQRNLGLHKGLSMAEAVSLRLSPILGRPAAHALLEAITQRASEQHSSLYEALCSEPAVTQHLSPEQLSEVLEPAHYLGSSSLYIDQVLNSALAQEELYALR